MTPFQYSSNPPPELQPQSQLQPPSEEIINPFNLYFGFKKSTGIFGNLMSSTAFSNDDILNSQQINSLKFDTVSNQSETNNSNITINNNTIINHDENKENKNTINDNNIHISKMKMEAQSPKLRFNNINSKSSSNSSDGGGSHCSKARMNRLKPRFEKGKSYQNLADLNIFNTDSGDEISMIGDSEPDEGSLGYSLTQSLKFFDDHKSTDYFSMDRSTVKFEKRIKEDENNEDSGLLNDTEITKKAKQNAKDSLLKFIPKIIDENINTKELKLFKYNFDNFDFSNIILMNNYLNNAKQINSLQSKLQPQNEPQSQQQQQQQQQQHPSDTILNSSLNENYEISAPFSSIFEHTVIYAISKQNEIIDYSIMNYFMSNLEFVQQLKQLSSFYLINDGIYACQLKNILFDSRNGINILKNKNPFNYNYNLIVNNLNSNSLIASATNFFFTNNNKVTSDSKFLFQIIQKNIILYMNYE